MSGDILYVVIGGTAAKVKHEWEICISMGECTGIVVALIFIDCMQSRRDRERGAVNTGQQWWQNNKRENYCTSDDDDGGIVAEGGGCFCGQIVNLTAVTVRQLVSSTCFAFIACGHCSGLWVTDWLKLELLKVKSCLHNSYDIRTGQYYTCHRSIDVCMGYKKWWLSPFRHCGGVMI